MVIVMNIIDFFDSINSERKLESLVLELEDAVKCFKDDKKNNQLRENVIFKQFADKLLTDAERASYYGLPEGCRMRENAKIISPEKLRCGKYVWIGEGAVLDASGGLEIGSHTSIGLSVFVWTHSSYKTNITMSNYPESSLIERLPTKIGNGVFIGGPSVIYHGITIGDRTVVMPLSCVTKSFDGNCIIGGSPAKIVKMLD
jgi:acetyltransferase-like isoleucine patch superfamily enzyme